MAVTKQPVGPLCENSDPPLPRDSFSRHWWMATCCSDELSREHARQLNSPYYMWRLANVPVLGNCHAYAAGGGGKGVGGWGWGGSGLIWSPWSAPVKTFGILFVSAFLISSSFLLHTDHTHASTQPLGLNLLIQKKIKIKNPANFTTKLIKNKTQATHK